MNPALISPARILAVEDDPVLGAFVHEQLQRQGFQVTWCQDGQQALALAIDGPFDVVLMDVLLPGLDGLEVLQRLRLHARTPVIMMSALGSEQDRIAGFRRGADDYLPKPFSVDELQVRVEAILRRVALERGGPLLQAASSGLQFHAERQDVSAEGRFAGLTPSEYRLLSILHQHLEEPLSKAFLYQHVLQRGYSQHDRSLDMHVSQIRRKLKAADHHGHSLRTVWGKGYVLSTQVQH